VHLASGLPCALCFQGDDDEPKLGHDVPRECEIAALSRPILRDADDGAPQDQRRPAWSCPWTR